MAVNRRTFLRLLGPAVLMPAVPVPAGAEGTSDALFLILDGIGPDLPADLLRAFAGPFLEAHLPLGIIPPLPPQTGPGLPPALAAELARLLAAAPHLVEPVLPLPGPVVPSRYFQRRAASDALARMRGLLGGAPGAPGRVPPPVTVATAAPPLVNLDALRCLGIRNVLALSEADTVTSTGCARLTVCLRGGRTMAVAGTPDPARWLEAAFDARGWRQIVLSLAGAGHLAVPEMRLRAQRACDAIGREIGAARRFVALPRDHARWFGEDQIRYLSLRLRPGDGASAAAMARLAAEIAALGVPLTETPPPADGEGRCAALALTGPDGAGVRLWSLRCDPAETAPDGLADIADLLLVPGADPAFDGRGLFVRGETALVAAAGLAAEDGLMRDAVLSLGPEDCATDGARAATLAMLRRLRGDAGTRFADLAGFHAATVAPDPIFDLLRDMHRAGAEGPDPDPLSEGELLADARQAWRFFERFSIPATGLCVDTADVQEGGEWLQREMTMWDVGSLIAALMAAQEMGLIGDADFVARIARVVDTLPAARIAGLVLPNAVIASDSGNPLSADFNACDTGRLLSVLAALDAHPLTRGIAAPVTGRWDLGGVVIGGRVHSVVDGRFVDRFRSHCAHYTARAFRSRGIEAASPYEVMGEGPQADRGMRLLEALVGLDPLGAEPLLLEAVEMGLSEPSALLAEVLAVAQRQEHARTGTPYCLSEAPINREPWFSYQGLNVASATERWLVNAVSSDPRFATPAFRAETLLVNTKAAYLWAAARPGAYATLLVRHVRGRARLEGIGFSPGVFAATGRGMAGYADVNTNGIILEAIAYILRGRRPRPR